MGYAEGCWRFQRNELRIHAGFAAFHSVAVANRLRRTGKALCRIRVFFSGRETSLNSIRVQKNGPL